MTLIGELICVLGQMSSLPKARFRHYWVTQQIVVNLALAMLVEFSHSLTSLYLAMALLSLTALLEVAMAR